MGKIIGSVEGADVYLILSLIIFMLVFILVIVYLVGMSKERIKQLEMLPLNETEENEK